MFRSLDHRNTAAADAATAFYRLAEIESLYSIVADTLRQLTEARQQAEQLREEALVENDVVEKLRRQQADAREKLSALLLKRIQLNGQLRTMLDCRLDSPLPYWPEANLHASAVTIDKDLEVSEGLATRPDLRALRLAWSRLDSTTLPIIRGVLGVADGSLGTVAAGGGRLRNLTEHRLVDHEVFARDEQLQLMLYNQEQAVTAEILSASWQIETAQRQVAIAAEKLESRRREVKLIEQQRETSRASALDLQAAQVFVHQATAEFVQSIVALRLAEVELKRAKGVLALECGFDWSPCCEAL